MGAEDPILEAKGLKKGFKRSLFGSEIHALRGLSLRLEPGEALGLLGPNGAGKSTAIRLLMGLLRPDEGELLLFGAPPTPEARRRVGYLPQGLRLYPYLSPRELLGMVGEHLGLGAEATAKETAALAAALELAPLLDRPIGELSGGQQQRIGLAQACLGDPPLLVLDEPLSGLDPDARRRAVALLTQRVKDGAALLISSHLVEDLEGLCVRFALLEEGRIREERLALSPSSR